MKWHKVVSILSFCLFITIFGFKLISQRMESPSEKDSELNRWQTFIQDEKEDNIIQYDSTPEELQAIDPGEAQRISEQSEQQEAQRRPASSEKTKRSSQKILGRTLMGGQLPANVNPRHLHLSNRYNESWKEELAEQLLRFQSPDTKVFVKRNQSVVKVKGKKAKLYEVVTISYYFGDESKMFNSYNALVDSQTGRVQQTWNQSTHEPLRGQRMRVHLTPSGSL